MPDPGLINWFVVFVRAGTLIFVFPAFSAQGIPPQVRIGLAALLAFLASPFLPPAELADASVWSLVGLLFVEASIGLLLGFVCRLVFFAIDLAGGIISTEMGLSLSSAFNPLTSGALPVPGLLLFWLGMMLLFTLNLHHWVIAAFQHTYELLPAGGAHVSESLALEVIRLTSQIFRVAVQMTAPVMAVAFVITLIFSVISRAVPQMNVFVESFSVRSLAGLAVFGFTCHLMAQHIENYLRRIPEDVVRIASLLASGS
jgi:flagellar biosynthetic protein FliR